MRAIVGYTGFVGGNILRFFKFDYMYNSKNFFDACNMEFDELFFCGLPAEKWKVNKDPHEDEINIQKIKDILTTIKVKKIILISTIDIYENTNSEFDEDYIPNYKINHAYGKHRYLFEEFIMNNFDNYYIIRIPALFGMGLKKNYIYDLINNNQIENISKNTKFQWYSLDWLGDDIKDVISSGKRICNLFPEPLETIKILELFDYSLSVYNEKKIEYNMKTKYNTSGYVRTKEECLNKIKQFIDFTKKDKSKLRVSNIYPFYISQKQFFCIVSLFGIKQLQIAPTMVCNGKWLFDSNFKQITNIDVTSLQSITYGLTENIFIKPLSLLEHLQKVIKMAFNNNIKTLVFGCPKNRNISDGDNIEDFITFFRIIGDICFDKNITICIEPNSIKYTNFLNNVKDVGDIVRNISHPNIKMMVDIGHLNNDDLYEMYNYIDIIYNIDVSVECMKELTINNTTELHYQFAKVIKDIKYSGNINLEMLSSQKSEVEELQKLNESLFNFICIYSD